MSKIFKALSVREPWVHMIFFKGKTIETRIWKTNYRGPLVICAARTFGRGKRRMEKESDAS